MKRSVYFFLTLMAVCILAGCNSNSNKAVETDADTTQVAETDTTIYGICGEGTTMHNLELITNDGDTLNFLVNEGNNDDDDAIDAIRGGLISGDKLAVIRDASAAEPTAAKVINLTTLEGKWTSLARNFEIVEGGELLSTLQSETNPYTSWRILNGQLLMGRDTFDILTLGADTLELENSQGIFIYTRK